VTCLAVAAGEEISAGGGPGKSSIICLFINVYTYMDCDTYRERKRRSRSICDSCFSKRIALLEGIQVLIYILFLSISLAFFRSLSPSLALSLYVHIYLFTRTYIHI